MLITDAINNIPIVWHRCIKSIHLNRADGYYEGIISLSVTYADGGLPNRQGGIGVGLADKADLMAQGVDVMGWARVQDYKFVCNDPVGQFGGIEKLLGKLIIYMGERGDRLYYQIGRPKHDSLNYHDANTIIDTQYQGKSIVQTSIEDTAKIEMLWDTLNNYLRR